MVVVGCRHAKLMGIAAGTVIDHVIICQIAIIQAHTVDFICAMICQIVLGQAEHISLENANVFQQVKALAALRIFSMHARLATIARVQQVHQVTASIHAIRCQCARPQQTAVAHIQAVTLIGPALLLLPTQPPADGTVKGLI